MKHKNTKKLTIFIGTIKKNKTFKKLLEKKERINSIMLPFEALQKAINNT